MKKIAITAVGVCLGLALFLVIILNLSRQSGGWVLADRRNPMNDSMTFEAKLPSLDQQTTLLLTCQPGQRTSLLFAYSQRVGGYRDDQNFAPRMVRYRFDQGPVRDTVGIFGDQYVGFNENSLKPGTWWDDDLLKDLPKASKLTATIEPVDGGEIVSEFELSGVESAVERLEKSCSPTNE